MDIVKDKRRLTLKLFILVWGVLFLQIFLKLTFNYWQPYVIPTEQLKFISDFIDGNRWLEIILNGIFYMINAYLMILAGIQKWWFKNIKQTIIVSISIVVGFIMTVLFPQVSITAFIIAIGIPLILDVKKWAYIILTFALSNVFMALSLLLEGFANANEMNYVIKLLFQNDYYIMLALNYILFNFIRQKKEVKKNG